MLILLAPSKTLDMMSPLPFAVPRSELLFQREAMDVYRAISALSPDTLMKKMKLSTALAAKVWQLYHLEAVPKKASLWAYVGDVYRGVQAPTLDKQAADWAQEHLCIISALFGLLRPYDEIFPYRLEMQAKIYIQEHATMYEFWGNKLARYVESREKEVVVVLSSQEYAKAVTTHLQDVRVVTPRFFDTKPDGSIGQVPIYSKQMRGVMARWMIDVRCEDIATLLQFNREEYLYDEARSSPGSPAYTRKRMRPLALPTKRDLRARP